MCTNAEPVKRTRPPGRAGFTLIELLTVVAIIGLLVGMVVPTIQAVMSTQVDVKTLARSFALNTGVSQYKMNGTGNRYFPGQGPTDRSASAERSLGSDYSNAASAYLAWCLFSKPDPNATVDDETTRLFPRDNWAPYEAGMLDLNKTYYDVKNTILDTYAQPMALVYYPSAMDASRKGLKTQFLIDDNKTYTIADRCAKNESGTVLNIQTWPAIVGPPVRMDGEYILHAAGKERLYFTGRLTNWRD